MADIPEPKKLQHILIESTLGLFAPEELTFRPMFGGILAYLDGKPYASLYDGGIAFKIDPKTQEQVLVERNGHRLQYEPDAPPSKQYIQAPAEVLRNTESLREWAELSAGYVRTLQKKKKK